MTTHCAACKSKTVVVMPRWRGLRRYHVIRCLACHVWVEEPRWLRGRLRAMLHRRSNQAALGLIGVALVVVVVTLVSVLP